MRSITPTLTGKLAGACALAMVAGPALAQVAVDPMPIPPMADPAAPMALVEPPLVLGPPAAGLPLLAAPGAVLAAPGAIVGTQTFAAAPPAAAVDPTAAPQRFAMQPQVAMRALTICDDAMLNPHAYSTQTTIECATQANDALGDSGTD